MGPLKPVIPSNMELISSEKDFPASGLPHSRTLVIIPTHVYDPL